MTLNKAISTCQLIHYCHSDCTVLSCTTCYHCLFGHRNSFFKISCHVSFKTLWNLVTDLGHTVLFILFSTPLSYNSTSCKHFFTVIHAFPYSKNRQRLKSADYKCKAFWLVPGRPWNAEGIRWFKLVRIEEGWNLIGQFCQDALGKGHTVSLQWEIYMNE